MVDCIKMAGNAGKRRAYIAEDQGQRDGTALEVQAVEAGHLAGPGRAQGCRQRSKFRLCFMQACEIFAAEGMLFHREVMQALRTARIGLPRVPDREEVGAGAEAGYEDGEAVAPLPPRWQVIAVPGEREFGRGEGHHSGRICGNRMTSRIEGELVSSITRRSMPMPQPPVGGRPYSRARMKSAS